MEMRYYHAAGKELISTALGRGGRVQDECEKLRGIVREAKAMTMDLEWLLLLNEGDVKAFRLWEKFSRLYCEADNALDELSYEAMRIHQMEEEEKDIQQYCMTTKKVSIKSSLSFHHPSLFLRKMSFRIKEFQYTIDKVRREMESLNSTSSTGGLEKHEIDSPLTIDCEGDFSREKQRLIEVLTNPNNKEKLSVIAIPSDWRDFENNWKREVIRSILDYELIRKHFDPRIWIDVPFNFDVKCTLKEIIEQSLGRNIECSTNWDNLLRMLEEILSGKRFLLVLYDAWLMLEDKEKLDNLTTLLRVGSRGSTIIIVARREYCPDVDQFNFTAKWGEIWAAFKEEAFGRVEGTNGESDELERIGMEISKEYQNDFWMSKPLSSMMRLKTNIQEWKAVLNTVKSFHGRPFSALKICYIDMEPPLRRCYVYSCMALGSNYKFQKKKLIQQWMAQGLLEETAATSSSASNNNSTGGRRYNDAIPLTEEDVGSEYFNALVLRNFFQVVKLDAKGDPLECQINFFSYTFAKSLPSRLLFGERLYPRVLEHTYVKDDYLSFSTIIGGDTRLKNLRYLDLSYGMFKALPDSLCKLHHLQILKLLHCTFLQRLPQGMRKLINLRHLEIERTLLNIPRGLRQLSNLQTLAWFRMGNKEDDVAPTAAAGIEELGCLQQLGGSLGLTGLNNVKEEDAKAAKLNQKKRLQELTLEWESTTGGDEDSKKQQEIVLEELQPHENLLLLRILFFGGTHFPKWLDNNNHLSKLLELCIYSCHRVKSLDLTGLRSLQKLQISYCENLEYARIKGVKKLELLEFKRCDKLKSLVGGNQSHVSNLLSLAKLQINSCDHLTHFPEKETLLLQSLKTLHIVSCKNEMVLMGGGLKNLTSLQDLHIENCPNLKELSDGAGQLKSLEHFSIDGCPKLKFLSKEMQHWSNLRTLTISACENLRDLLRGINMLTSLEKLEINGCGSLITFPLEMQDWRKLRTLTISACANLRDLPRGICMLTSLEKLEISGCGCLIIFPDEIQELKCSLRILKIEQCPYLGSISTTLVQLSSLAILEISNCKWLMSLPGGLQKLTSLEILKIKGCDELENLPEEMGHPSTLRVLEISGCPSLTLFPDGLGKLQTLSRLEISDCCNLKALPTTLGNLSSLQFLYIKRCHSLASIPNTLPHMESLRVLWLIDCASLANISSGLGCLSSIEKLTVWGCLNLLELLPPPQGIQHMKSMKELTISNCSKLKTLPDGLEELSSLEKLVIWSCPKLKSSKLTIDKLLSRGIKLEIKDCPFLKDVIHSL